MMIEKHEHLYEVLLRFDESGLKGAHILMLETVREGDEVLSTRLLPAKAVAARDLKPFLGDKAALSVAALGLRDEALTTQAQDMARLNARISQLESELAAVQAGPGSA